MRIGPLSRENVLLGLQSGELNDEVSDDIRMPFRSRSSSGRSAKPTWGLREALVAEGSGQYSPVEGKNEPMSLIVLTRSNVGARMAGINAT